MKYLLLLSVLLFSSCFLNPFRQSKHERQKNRAMRKIEKQVAKFPELAKDSIVRFDSTVYVPHETIDTQFVMQTHLAIESVTVVQDRAVIRYIRRNDTVMLRAECEGDTIRIVKEVPVKQIVIQEQSQLKKVGRFLLFLLILFIVAWIIKKLT